MKTILMIVALSLFAALPAAAATAQAPGPNQVVIVARIALDPPIPFDFYRATREADRSASSKNRNPSDPDATHVFIGIRSDATFLKLKVDHLFGLMKGVGRATVQVPADRRIEVGPFRVAIFGSEYLTITIPARWSILVPEGTRFVYLGTLTFSYEGSYYDFTGMEQIDEFDEAQAIITEVYGKDARLIRVNLLDIEEE